ncbi:MAG: hypothetical protein A2941_03310 [Candidatus Yanofskybacteria bacterium RIFCSPLOWO2_01_FULL_49_17]|uniref:Peptidoglycan binding-like domain-containing protein n=1 Tax=Candidatus Yanofskybacteria bacterium RIFCSPLOWO2_01_FULL_49_17 TaxID=1802700 RepID=A0A1F8GRA6_9BACT|nr:MAG: hypothetical protein A2941_03310 [Candidatus Yanofskybacteria bacterium RIFCSPLOWO2_01_FULL_49_17]
MRNKFIKKTASIMLSVSTIGWLAGASALMPMAASADATSDLIAQLQAQIAALQAQLTTLAGGSSAGSAACSFSRDFTLGSRGDDVKCLQSYLTSTGHYSYSGGATGYFGSITKSAVSAWQAANGVSPTAGYFGALSRAKYTAVAGSVVVTPTTPTTPTTPGTPATVPAASGTLRVDAGVQPGASLFPVNSVRVPFTVVKFTAPSGQDVTINSLTVERTGLAQDTAFSGVLLLDETGVQVGISRTLNSVHQVLLNEPFVVKSGTTRTMTLAGNAQTSNNSLAGQIAYLSLVSVNSSLPVAGTLPIAGAGHTVNESLTIGSVTVARGPLDPGTSQTKRMDAMDFVFSSVKVTAGSGEKVYLTSIRWNQSGSAAGSDLANLKTSVDGTAYDTTISSDGKYYTAAFPGKGLLIDKGFSKEISIKGDIVGGTLRTVDFDIAKRSDLGVYGETYGYGINAPVGTNTTADSAAFKTTDDPWYDAAQVEIGAGTITVSNSTTVPAQNIAVNLASQPLGAFSIEVKGEPVQASRIGFNFTLGSDSNESGGDADINDITSVTLVDENGAVVAGPVDGTAANDHASVTGVSDGAIVFSDTVTFPVGIKIYKLLGKVGTDIESNMTITASTTPQNDWAGTVRGTVSGTTVTVSPNSILTLPIMTVKSGAMTVTVASSPIAQTVIAGVSQFTFSNYIFDATGSGEDVRIASVPLANFATGGGTYSDLVTCGLFDGATRVTSTKSPSSAASTTSFTFSGGGYTVPKGTAKTFALKCDLIASAAADSKYQWGIDAGQNGDYTGMTGITSGQSVTETFTDAGGNYMTVAAAGTMTFSLDANSPPYKVISAGATGVELSRIKFVATNEDIDLKKVALQLSGTASNTPDELVLSKVTLWDATTGLSIGEATFPAGDNATSSAIATNAFRIPKGGSRVLIVKGDIGGISASGPIVTSGQWLKVDVDGANAGLNGTYGTGVASGSTVSDATPTDTEDTASNGVRIMKAYPQLARVPLSTTERALPHNLISSANVMYKWSVKAVGGDVGLYKFNFLVSSSTMATTSNWSVYVYTDSGFSQLDTNFNATGILNYGPCWISNFQATYVSIYPDKGASGTCAATTTYTVPAGATRYFKATADVTTGVGNIPAGTTDSFTVKLRGDSAYSYARTATDATNGGEMYTGLAVDAANTTVVSGRFIWSPISTSTSLLRTDDDWTNGYQIEGLPASGMDSETLASS